MAKRNAGRRGRSRGSAGGGKSTRRVAARPVSKTRARRRAQRTTVGRAHGRRKTAPRKKSVAKAPKSARPRLTATSKKPRLDRVRRTFDETVPGPPSSLAMDRHASAASTGRAELQQSLQEHTGMTPALTGGDVDANWENAYFSGDEAPGGDNPTPDQDVVEDIGRALGVEYQDNEELQGADKVVKRDKHRWELDPASSEDYKERK